MGAMSNDTGVPNVSDGAVSGLDGVPLTARKPSTLAGAYRSDPYPDGAPATGQLVDGPLPSVPDESIQDSTINADGGTPDSEGGVDGGTIDSPYDPSDFTVDEVNDYLAGDITTEERDRVLGVEQAGKARKGILGE